MAHKATKVEKDNAKVIQNIKDRNEALGNTLKEKPVKTKKKMATGSTSNGKVKSEKKKMLKTVATKSLGKFKKGEFRSTYPTNKQEMTVTMHPNGDLTVGKEPVSSLFEAVRIQVPAKVVEQTKYGVENAGKTIKWVNEKGVTLSEARA